MKLFLFGLLVISAAISSTFPSTSTQAAPAIQSANEAVDLQAIVAGVQRKYSRMKGLAADFVQVYHGSDGRTVRESGHLLLKRQGKARWDYLDPERKVFLSDGRNIYFHVHGEPYASKVSVKQSGDPQIPFLFLLGRTNIQGEFSRIELLSTERAVVPGNRVLRLVPARAPDEFKRLLAEVNPSSFEVKRLVIFERGGGRMDFVLSNVRENHVAPDSEFTFTPPPGVTIKAQ
jgi:chaperone LolA